MLLFFTRPNQQGEQIQQEINIDSLDVASTNYFISIRKGGIRIRDKRLTPQMGEEQEQDIILNQNLDLG